MKKIFTLLFSIICSLANSQTTNTYSYTGAVQTFTVPSCVSSLTVEVRGAAGGASGMGAVNGGAVYGVISVTPGQVLNIFVGGQGSITAGGFNGGGDGGGGLAANFGAGGGGASDIRIGGTSLGDRLIVAGGGGGAGGGNVYTPSGGTGGGGLICLSPNGYGGQQGFGCGVGGAGACSGGSSLIYGTGGSGGGLNSGGGASGDGNGSNGSAGALGFGGIGGSVATRNGGGGGGGGYYGGAGGMSGNFGCNGGGGGGSSYANNALLSNISFTAGAQSGHGLVNITFNALVPPDVRVNSGSATVNIGSGSTPNSSFSPWYFYFADPTPPGARVLGYTLSFDAVDQGWGGSGCYLNTTVSGDVVGGGVLSHTLQNFNYSYNGPVTSYSPGVTNYFSMNFCGWGGWQSFIYNAVLVIHYDIGEINLCNGLPVTLNASGAATYTWNNGITNGTPFTPTSSALYSVVGTSTNGCSVSNTVQINVNPLPSLAVSGPSMVCEGDASIQTVTGADTYTWSTSATTNTIIVTPSGTYAYSVAGTNTTTGCASSLTGSLYSSPIPTLTTSNYTICEGNSVNLSASGAFTFTYSSGSALVTPTVTTSYSITGTSAFGCAGSNTAISAMIVNPLPAVSISGATTSCAGDLISLSANNADTYLWNTTATSQSISPSPLVSTTYSIVGTNTLTGCSNTAAATATVNPRPTIAITNGTICNGSTFILNPSGAVTYTFSSGSNTVTPSATSNFSVIGTGTNGCTNSVIATVVVNPIPTISVNSGSICSGQSFSIVPSGAATYSVSGGSFIVSPAVNSSYTIAGTSAAGCQSTVSAISSLSVISLPTISVSNYTICSGNSVVLTPSGATNFTFSGGSATVSPPTTTSYSITGSNAQGCVSASPAVSIVNVNITPTVSVNSGSICQGQTFTILPSGAVTYTIGGGSFQVSPATNTTYIVNGTSAEGCVGTVLAISNVSVLPLPVISVNSGTICEGLNFTMVPSGAASYTFSSGSAIVSPSITSSYSVNGSSSAGCLNSVPAISTVSVFARPVIALNSGSICSGQSFTITPSGANTYTYLNGGPIVSPISSNQYSISGSSIAGCASTIAAVSNVTVFATPIISVNSGSICANSIFTMIPSGANTYTFSGGNSATVSPIANSVYSVSGTSTAGCTSTVFAISNVTVHSLPIITVNSGSICVGETFTMLPSGATTYTFSNGSSTVSPLVSTNYSVSGTSSLGCVSSAPAVSSLTVNTIPAISVNSGSICSGQNFTLVPTGANTYTYLNGGPIVSPVASGNYSVVGTSSAGCVSSATAISSVTVLATPVISVNSGSICANSVFTITPSGAATYTYSGGNSATVSPAATAIYSVSGTSTAGCTSTTSALSTVTVINLPFITVPSGSICQGETFTLNPSGAGSYTFSNGNPTVNPMVTTSYSITGTSSVGCLSSNTAVSTVTVHETPTISVSSGSICSGQTYTISPSGALTYTVSGGSFTVNPLFTSTFSVSGTSSAGCNSSVDAVSNVVVETTPTITVNSGTICYGDSFTISPTGANTYSIQGAAAIVSPTASTSYTIVGYSIGACPSAQESSSITVNSLPIVTASLSSVEICTGNSITASAAGANTYTWSNGTVNNSAFSPTTSASYTVLGEDANGCINSASVSVLVNPLPNISINSTHSVSCEAETVTLSVSGAQNYLWSDASTGLFIAPSPTSTATYSVVGTDTNGCSSSAQIVQSVTVCAETISAFALPENVTCQRKKDGKIVINAAVAYQNYSIQYLWNPENLCPTADCDQVDSLDAGTYGVTVKITYTLNNILVKQDSVVLGPITLTDVGSECILNVFQGVSANNDGVNDHLYIENIEQFPKNRVTLFNRWGNKVAEIDGYDNINVTWPRSEEVQSLQPSTYFYIINLGDGSNVIKGWIELVKN